MNGNVFVPKTPEAFYYDLDGNLTNDGRWTYYWDAENRLVQMAANTGVGPQISLKFEYDALSRRIRKQVWANTSWTGTPTNDLDYVYDGWNLVSMLNATNHAELKSFLWGLDLSGTSQGAGGVGGLIAINDAAGGSGFQFAAFDGNGNVSALMKASDGTVSAVYEYGPFGEVIRATGAACGSNPFRFSSKYRDAENGLLYYGYRYYGAGLGRWTSRDPREEVGFDALRSSKWLTSAGADMVSPTLLSDYCFSHNQGISAFDVLGLQVYPCGSGEKPVPMKTISYRKSTIEVSIVDLILPEEKSKLLKRVKDSVEAAERLWDLIGSQYDYREITECVPNPYVPTSTTVFNWGPQDPPFEIVPESGVEDDVIIYWYLETDYTYHCPGFQNVPPCSDCNKNGPPSLPPLDL